MNLLGRPDDLRTVECCLRLFLKNRTSARRWRLHDIPMIHFEPKLLASHVKRPLVGLGTCQTKDSLCSRPPPSRRPVRMHFPPSPSKPLLTSPSTASHIIPLLTPLLRRVLQHALHKPPNPAQVIQRLLNAICVHVQRELHQNQHHDQLDHQKHPEHDHATHIVDDLEGCKQHQHEEGERDELR